ncbi:MAG: hypothetical protein UH687_05880, partial [Bacteroidaceae bacterium]|nr:hypothetical protein [Bacteroidaceae bacterium]
FLGCGHVYGLLAEGFFYYLESKCCRHFVNGNVKTENGKLCVNGNVKGGNGESDNSEYSETA